MSQHRNEVEFVDLVTVDGAAPRDAEPGERHPTGLIGRWLALPLTEQAIVVATIVAFVIAGCVGVSAAHVEHPVHDVTRKVLIDNPPAGVHARGCPVTATCIVRSLPVLSAEVRRLVPALHVDYALEVVDASRGTVYRRDLLAHDPRDQLSVVRLISACVPGGAGNTTGITGVSQRYVDPPGGGFGAPARTRMTPVRNGCFGYISYQATPQAAATPGLYGLLQLVGDPALQVHR